MKINDRMLYNNLSYISLYGENIFFFGGGVMAMQWQRSGMLNRNIAIIAIFMVFVACGFHRVLCFFLQ